MSLKAKLNLKPSVTPVLTASDWQLYNLPESNAIASLLNQELHNTVARFNKKEDAKAEMLKTMSLFKSAGATDTEPRELLCELLDLIYD